MADARDGSWGGHRLTSFCLAAKLSLMGADVDGLACRLHQPTDCGWKAWVWSSLTGVVLSHHVAWVGAALDHLSRGCEAPGMGYLMRC
jgi:hypothetical protein